MRNPYQVLREKERELEKVTREVEALRLVGPLLEGEDTSSEPTTTESDERKDATTGLKIPTQKWP